MAVFFYVEKYVMMKRAIGLAISMGLVKPVTSTKAVSKKIKSPARERKSLVSVTPKRKIFYRDVKRRGQM